MIVINKTNGINYFRKIFNMLIIKYLEYNNKNIDIKTNELVLFAHDYISYNIMLQGIYEKEDLDLLIKFLKSKKLSLGNMTTLDIGANIGNHTIYFSKYFKKVISFEPNKQVFELLKINSLNMTNVEIHNLGVSDSNIESEFHFCRDNHGGGKVIKQGEFRNEATIKVDLIRLDEFEQLKSKKIDLIKIDIEGHEKEALQGATKLIELNKPIILFEQGKDEIRLGTSKTFELLKSFGYRNFYSIESNNLFKRFMIGRVLLKLILGEKRGVKKIEKLQSKNYSFLIAVPNHLGE